MFTTKVCCPNLLSFRALSFETLVDYPFGLLTIDFPFSFFFFLPNSANFSRHHRWWRHLSLFVQPNTLVKSSLKFRHIHSHTMQILYQIDKTGSHISQRTPLLLISRLRSVRNGCIQCFLYICVRERLWHLGSLHL